MPRKARVVDSDDEVMEDAPPVAAEAAERQPIGVDGVETEGSEDPGDDNASVTSVESVEYDVVMTKPFTEELLLVQYPNRPRTEPYSGSEQHPIEMRIKPGSGFLEVDVPVDTKSTNYDPVKGTEWGEALKLSKDTKADQFGIASGFGKAVRANDTSNDKESSTAEAGTSGGAALGAGLFGRAAMNVQTLGGQIIRPEPGKPIYMCGVIRGKQIHLTPIDGMVQMRPQFHHIDAVDRLTAARNARANAVGKDEPRTVTHMQVARNANDNADEINTQKTAQFLTIAAEEQWLPLNYHDENSQLAMEMYEERMILKDAEAAPQLHSSMTDQQYLDKISCLSTDKKKKRDARLAAMHAAATRAPDAPVVEGAEEAEVVDSTDDDDAESDQDAGDDVLEIITKPVKSAVSKGKGKARA